MTVAIAQIGAIQIAYECLGSPDHPTVLLIGGLGQQLIGWDPELCARFVDRGWRLVRYDNRDTGRSTHLEHLGPPELTASGLQAAAAAPNPSPYGMSDMAGDAAGLLDHLGIARAHVVGVSMGGMIAQQLLIDHPHRVTSLTSIMSTTGPAVAPPTPEAAAVLSPAPVRSAEEAADRAVAEARITGSPGYPADTARIRRRAREAYTRSFDPAGVGRQLIAILSSPDRAAQLRRVRVPTLVIHGTDDPLIPMAGGRVTADATGGRLELVDGLGHDLPPALFDRFVTMIDAHLRAAEAGR